jgi:hypothetical protein
MPRSRDDWIGATFGLLVVLPIIVSFLTGAGVIAWQSLQWLEHASWPDLTLQDGLKWLTSAPVKTDWLGINHIIDTSPLSLWLMLLFPAGWLTLGMWVSGKVMK